MTTSLAAHFEWTERADGSRFVRLVDTRPDWLLEAVRQMHGDELPNDWRYRVCFDIATLLDEGITDAAEIADGLTDDRISDLVAWVGHGNRASIVDQAIKRLGHGDGIFDDLQRGQFYEIERMASILMHEAADAVLG